jgi:FkbM family methyltransferase
MNIRALYHNIIVSIRTTTNVFNAVKKLGWLYNKLPQFTTGIKFKYPYPIGKINLKVRSNRGADAFIISEVFEQECYWVSLNNITHIVDLGANAGFTAVYFSKLFPSATIACVEPMPVNISVLKRNLALNKVTSVVYEAAITIKDEKTLMDIGDKDYANKVHNIPFGKSMDHNTLTVDGLSMDTMLKKLKWETIDLLKIDIEGYEGILLTQNNDWLNKVETIIVELHEGVTIDIIKNATHKYGFVHVVLKKGNWLLSKNEISDSRR